MARWRHPCRQRFPKQISNHSGSLYMTIKSLLISEQQQQRRKHPRAPCQWKGHITTQKNKAFLIQVKNVSLGGLGIKTEALLKKGDKVLLEAQAINGDHHQKIRVICTVAFIILQAQSYEVGLQFTSNTKTFIEFIRSYVNIKTK